MCGICGVIDPTGAPVDPAGVRAMLDAMTHRGPDSWGLIEAPGATAGIRRLRVVDLVTGDQPIRNEDGQIEVVFNGEIYNHAVLRDRLQAA
jgi:asparagine synthase (glutamine-hydrolysing)